MPKYRRARSEGGTFFFTLVTECRAPLFSEARWRLVLRDAIDSARASRSFDLDAIVLLPDHLHLLMTMPKNDSDYSTRLSSIKATFTRAYLEAGGTEQPRSESRVKKRRRGIWQRWFWEHRVRDADDFRRHVEYMHFNPVKHGVASCPHAWPFSSFGKYVERNILNADWCCGCDGRIVTPPDTDWASACEPPE